MLAVVGATASGKSSVAMRLAEHHGADILSCDSVQVYRGFVIGCAKPSKAEQARVRHHLIDVVDWHEEFDAQRYCGLAMEAIASVRQSGRGMILCGGTGLYLRALRYGLIDAPERDLALRSRLYAEEKAQPGVLYDRLQALDPMSARRIEPKNLVHVVRALEIHATTGELPSALRAKHGFNEERVPMQVIAIDRPRDELRRCINERVNAMVAEGLIDEVRQLRAQGVPPTCRPMRAVGYREVCAMLDGTMSASELPRRMSQATWEYARRQYTWLRREKNVTWLKVDGDLFGTIEKIDGAWGHIAGR
jgi:tRNA dimethylallyltransferase